MPLSATGTIGVPVSTARWKPPFLSGPSSPVRERLPSGAIHTLTPSAISCAARRRLSTACLRSERLTSIMCPTRMARPNSGTRNSSVLATMRSVELGTVA